MKHAYDIYSDRCPTRAVLDRIADKWALLILDRLGEGTTRFNALKREIEGISQKVLSQTLKALERDGLISRKAYPTVPVTVEYSLTPLGRKLAEAVAAFAHWAEANMDAIHKAQAAYDRRAGQVLLNPSQPWRGFRFHFLSEAGRHPKRLAISPAEVAGTRKPAAKGDLGDWHGGLAQQVARALQPDAAVVPGIACAQLLREQPVELAGREPDAARGFAARQRVARVALHQFERGGQPLVMHAEALRQRGALGALGGANVGVHEPVGHAARKLRPVRLGDQRMHHVEGGCAARTAQAVAVHDVDGAGEHDVGIGLGHRGGMLPMHRHVIAIHDAGLGEDHRPARYPADPDTLRGERAQPGQCCAISERHGIAARADEQEIERPRLIRHHAGHGGAAGGGHHAGARRDVNPAVKLPTRQQVGGAQRLHHRGIGHQREAGDEQQADILWRVWHGANISENGFLTARPGRAPGLEEKHHASGPAHALQRILASQELPLRPQELAARLARAGAKGGI